MFKSKEVEAAYNRRLGRYMAAIRMESVDRVPLAFNTCYYAEKNSGYNFQEILYDPEKWEDCEFKFAEKYPEVDTFRSNIAYAPTWDVLDYQLYRIPGREISPNSLQQFVESDWMKEDEYQQFIDDPVKYKMEVYFPRIFGEYKEKGSIRSYMAFLKSGFLQGIIGTINKSRASRLKYDYGFPGTTQSQLTAPFDILSDNYRGLRGIMRDMFKKQDEIIDACEKLMEINLNNCAALVDPKKQMPIFIATHKPCFMSPKQFDKFYWPTFYKGIMTMIEAGYTFRIFLEGNWEPHWDHLADFPKGSVLFDVDNEADIFKAKEAFGYKNCISGGIPTDMMILGTPDDIKERVKLLCETVGKDGGWIPQGGGHIPEDCKPENFQALIDAVNEYGRYTDGPAPMPEEAYNQDKKLELPSVKNVVTPWDMYRDDHGWKITGDEELIESNWNKLERMAYSWIIRS